MNEIFAVFSIIGMVAVVVMPLYWYLKRDQRKTLLANFYHAINTLLELQEEMATYKNEIGVEGWEEESKLDYIKGVLGEYEGTLTTVIEGLNELSI